MADAEVIPLGTRGRPGRGTGSSKPSSAARNLAGPAPPARRPAAAARARPAERPRRRDAATEPEPTESPEPPDAEAAAPTRPPEPAAPAESASATPTGGIPVGDWVAGARPRPPAEVFGDRWEPRARRVPGLPAPPGDRRVRGRRVRLRRRGRPSGSCSPRSARSTEKWFRVEVRGAENIPAEGGALVVSNHSGTVPVDGLMTMVSIHDTTGRNLRPLGADLVFRMPVVGELARKGGATLACNEDAQRMLSGGELVGVWPEGFKGIGKPYSERYKLQRFGRGGFVSAAIRTGVPIIPCSVVGAEEIYPLVGNVPALARLLGIPYLPITPFFPLLGPLGLVPLPSKWLIEFGEPIRTDAYDEGAADDPMLVFNVTDQVRETIQQTLYSLLMQRRSVFY